MTSGTDRDAAYPLEIARFGDTEPTPLPTAPISRLVRLRAWRIRRRAARMQRSWARKHGGLEYDTAMSFTFSDYTNLAVGFRAGNFHFIDFKMQRVPEGKNLSRWATAFALAYEAKS